MTPQILAARFLRRTLLAALPKRQRLPFQTWVNLALEGGEIELRHLERIVPPGCRIAVDVGANVGYYACRLSRLSRWVYAFELNERVSRDLRAARLANVSIVPEGLSDKRCETTLYVPLLRGTFPLDGWASLQPGNCPGVDEHYEMRVRVRPLDAFELRDVDFIKIDVEGHELSVISGARETLSASGPRLLVEVKDRNVAAVDDALRALGYREVTLHSLGVRGNDSANKIFERR